jgi:RNA polymerase sigma factor (sigma-70 family)
MSRVSDERAQWLAQHVLPHEPALRAWLVRGRDGGLDPDDVVQEAYATLAALDSVAHIRNPRTYLFSVAHSVALSYVRRARVVRIEAMAELGAPDVLVDEDPTPERIVADRQELRLVAALIRSLPGKCREAFTLRKVEGLPQREIARRMGVSESTVEKHISKALRLLMQQSGRAAAGQSRTADAAEGAKRVDRIED